MTKSFFAAFGERVRDRSSLILFALLLTLVTCYLLLATFAGPVYAQACPATGCPAPGLAQVQQLITRLINISVTVSFMALTVWLVWSALKFFITSGGDPKALSHAWSSVTWAFMGIFFLILAWLVIRLIAEVTGAPVDQYCLGFPPYCMP